MACLGCLVRCPALSSVPSVPDWPLPVLKRVVGQLIEETPSDLLARELWAPSTATGGGADAAYRRARSFATSSAVMARH